MARGEMNAAARPSPPSGWGPRAVDARDFEPETSAYAGHSAIATTVSSDIFDCTWFAVVSGVVLENCTGDYSKSKILMVTVVAAAL